MNIIDFLTIIVFTGVVLVTGISFSKTSQNTRAYFTAGGAVPWWISGLSLYMSFFSVGTFVVWGSIAYTHGFVAVSIQTTMCIAGIVVGLFIAPKWNQTRTVTAAQYIQERLGTNIQKIYAYLFLGISMFTTGAFLYPVAKIVEISIGIPLSIVIIVLGGLITLYTAVGGLWAVLVTDVLQFVVLSVAVLLLVPLCFQEVEGISGFITKAPEGFFDLQNEEYSWAFLFAFGLYNLIYIGGNWTYVQRYTSVANPKDARKVGLLFGALYLISPVIWMLPPMIYRVLNPDLEGLADEGAYLIIAKQVLPNGLLGLILGAMIFATASSVNSTLNIAAGVFTNDLYQRFRPSTSTNETMLVARLATVFFGIITIGIALLVQQMGGIVEVVLSIAAITGSAMFLPPIWILFSKKLHGQHVLITTLLSLNINALFKFLTPYMLDLSLSRTEEMMLGVFCPVVILLIFELIQRRKGIHQSYLKYSQHLAQRIEQDQQNQSTSLDTRQNMLGIGIIAKGILSIGLIILILGALAENSRGLFVFAALSVILIGAIIWQISRYK